MSPIDITKTYTTRDGRGVHLYEQRNGYFYGRFCHGSGSAETDSWAPASWTVNGGTCMQNWGTGYDLVPKKQWRAWRKNDAKPKFIITKDGSKLRLEAHCFFQSDCDAELQMLFEHYSWIHEDGSETPCGVLE